MDLAISSRVERPSRMLRQPPLRVRRLPDVKPIVFRGMQRADVKHQRAFYPESRVRRSPFTRIRVVRVPRIRHHNCQAFRSMTFLRAIRCPGVGRSGRVGRFGRSGSDLHFSQCRFPAAATGEHWRRQPERTRNKCVK